jgi:hypothetical protein
MHALSDANSVLQQTSGQLEDVHLELFNFKSDHLLCHIGKGNTDFISVGYKASFMTNLSKDTATKHDREKLKQDMFYPLWEDIYDVEFNHNSVTNLDAKDAKTNSNASGNNTNEMHNVQFTLNSVTCSNQAKLLSDVQAIVQSRTDALIQYEKDLSQIMVVMNARLSEMNNVLITTDNHLQIFTRITVKQHRNNIKKNICNLDNLVISKWHQYNEKFLNRLQELSQLQEKQTKLHHDIRSVYQARVQAKKLMEDNTYSLQKKKSSSSKSQSNHDLHQTADQFAYSNSGNDAIKEKQIVEANQNMTQLNSQLSEKKMQSKQLAKLTTECITDIARIAGILLKMCTPVVRETENNNPLDDVDVDDSEEADSDELEEVFEDLEEDEYNNTSGIKQEHSQVTISDSVEYISDEDDDRRTLNRNSRVAGVSENPQRSSKATVQQPKQQQTQRSKANSERQQLKAIVSEARDISETVEGHLIVLNARMQSCIRERDQCVSKCATVQEAITALRTRCSSLENEINGWQSSV